MDTYGHLHICILLISEYCWARVEDEVFERFFPNMDTAFNSIKVAFS